MKVRAQSAENEIAAKNQEIAKLREQLAARNPGPSSTSDGDSGEEEDDHDMHVMRQLLQDFRDQRLSPDDRQAMMQAAGDQFTDLLTQHWKENSTPPKWLWSLFQPVSTTPSAQVTQVNSPTARSSRRVAKNKNNGGSSSPSLIFSQPRVPAEPSSPINPRNLNRL